MSVVVVVAVAVADAADLFDEEVDGLSRPVRCSGAGVEREDLVVAVVHGLREPGELGDACGRGVLEEHDQPSLGVCESVGCVDIRQQFASQPDRSDLAVAIASSEAGAQAVPTAVVEVWPPSSAAAGGSRRADRPCGRDVRWCLVAHGAAHRSRLRRRA